MGRCKRFSPLACYQQRNRKRRRGEIAAIYGGNPDILKPPPENPSGGVGIASRKTRATCGGCDRQEQHRPADKPKYSLVLRDRLHDQTGDHAAELRLQSVDTNRDHATGRSEQQAQTQRKIGSDHTIK